jgi:hypothetical protein
MRTKLMATHLERRAYVYVRDRPPDRMEIAYLTATARPWQARGER